MANPRPSSSNAGLVILEGPRAVLAQSTLLEDLAMRCEQAGAMNWLEYFLSGQSAKHKYPWLVLLCRTEAHADDLRAGDVWAAVLFSEYHVLGCRTNAFSTNDLAGFRTVLAPRKRRQEAASLAIEAMLKRGAQLILATFAGGSPESTQPAPLWHRTDIRWARHKRVLGKELALANTFDDTLARLGKTTRRNLRYYRRRLNARLSCVFVPDAREAVLEQDLAALNAGSLNPIALAEFKLRWQSSRTLPGGFLMGLRDDRGRWLSLTGGWRQGETTIVQWQMNTAGFEKDSLQTVMRSYLLEHEVNLGTRRLVFHGGTPHSMRHYFEPEAVWDLVVRRRTLRAGFLAAILRLLASPRSVTGRANFLATVLHNSDLRWHDVTLPSAPIAAATAPNSLQELGHRDRVYGSGS